MRSPPRAPARRPPYGDQEAAAIVGLIQNAERHLAESEAAQDREAAMRAVRAARLALTGAVPRVWQLAARRRD